MTPGDRVSFSIKNKAISFQGKKAAQYNFFMQLDSTSTEYAKNKYTGDLLTYKKRTRKIYERRQKFFNTYIKQNKVSAEFKFEYLHNLIAPRTNPVPTLKGIYTNSQKDLLTIVAKDYSNIEEKGFFDLGAYLDHPSINDFKRPELINNDYFKRALVEFIREYFVNVDYLTHTKQRFLKEKNTSKKTSMVI